MSKNGITLKLGIRVTGSFKVIENGAVDRSYTTFYCSPINCKYSCMYVVPFSSYLTLNNHDLEKVS